MSEDSYTETTSTSWFSRLGNAFKGILIGLLLVIVAAVLLFWNEGRAVRRAQALKEGRQSVVSADAASVKPELNDKLVHLTGDAVTPDTLNDSAFNVSANAIKLERKVEMYQWKEEKKTEKHKKLGGGEEQVTTYSYEKVWSPDLISSGSFKKPGHDNPGSMPYKSQVFKAKHVTLGAFQLSEALIDQMNDWEEYPVSAPPAEQAAPTAAPTPQQPAASPTAQPTSPGKPIPYAGGYYIGQNPSAPAIGDARVTFRIVKPGTVSVVAKQKGRDLVPYTTSNGQALVLMVSGSVDAADMFSQAESENKTLTWILRVVGFVLMFVGIAMVLKPISVVADVIPLLGDISEIGVGLVSGLLAAIGSLVVIAIAWLFYRPLIGILLLALAVALIVVLRRRKKAAAAAKTA